MLGQLVGRSVQWADGRFSKKGGSICFPWYSIARTYPDPHKKVHILTVAIYGLILFPKTVGYIDVNVFEVFNQFQYEISHIPAILAETFLSLNACHQLEGGRFRGYAPLLYALKAEKDNTTAWKRKAHDSKICLTESQRAYNALEIQLNQSHAQYSQLEARVKEQEEMIREYQARDEYAELQASQNKIEKLEKEVKDLWALVQTCQINIQVLEDIKQGGNDYWFTRLRDAAHQFQEQDKINEKIMNLA
ncbi:hypothetical protein GQ457_01G019400 [Hibiscus cannabinus]